MVVGPSLILSLTLLATLVMAATKPPKSKTFPLRQLPSVPLMHILHLLPHSALANLAATCSFYHATLHSSPSLWRRLTLLPTMLLLVGSMDRVSGQARLLLLLEDSQMDLQTR